MKTLIIKSSVELSNVQKKNLETGILSKENEEINFVYEVGGDVIGIRIYDGKYLYDSSISKKLNIIKEEINKQFESSGITPEEIKEFIKSKYLDLDKNIKTSCGRVISSNSGVILIEGLSECRYKEIVLVGESTYALVMNLEVDKIGAIVLGEDSVVNYGDLVFTTGKIIEVPVGYEFLGRVVDPLCFPLDGLGVIKSKNRRKIENEAPRIVDRAKVNTPLETGILSLDAMIPIGKGQRQLIIGDRQTGKTSIALDVIINQKGKDVYCIYVAIGQRASSVSRIVKTLQEHNALSYTIVVLASASCSSSLQYIAPYTGTALADFFMYEGKDVLIVYDDLSKHAVSYRTISLLLQRPSGREAYPGDIFYIHSKLLERSAKLKDGGSMTALPIIETLSGDISSYIPTNVISITDGQIYLEKDLFNAGFRPAINVGLSVSRIGGAAQTKLMHKLSSHLRLDIASFRELAMFSQFGSQLDETTKQILDNGKKIEKALCQMELSPYSYFKEVVYLYSITSKLLKDIHLDEVDRFLELLLNYISSTTKINLESDDVIEQLNKVCSEFKKLYLGEDNG